MSIIRIKKKEHPYVQVDKRVLEDSRLSWRAKGILVYLLTKPDGWTVKVADIWGKGQEGRGAVQACLKELEKHGYAQLVTIKGEGTTFAGKEWQVNEEPIGGFLAATDKPKTDAPINRKPDSRAVNSNNESLSEINSNNEGEGTPPAPNPSNLQSQKKENGLVAPPGRDAAELLTKRISEEDFQDCLNRAAGNGQNAPLPKVAPKCIPPAGVESWPIDCEFCDGRGMKILDGGPVYCAECGGTGIEPAESNPQNFEVTAIASPTGLPGVTIVEAAPRPLRYDEYPNPRNANELKDRLKEYFTHHPEDWRLLIENAKVNWMPEKLEETTLAYCLHQEKEGNMKRTYNTYKAGLTTWFMRQKSWDAQNNAPKEGGQTRQNGQPHSGLPRSLQNQVGK